MICDFCGDVDPRRAYPVGEGKAWTACQQCAALIDADELLPLARRLVFRLLTRRLKEPLQPGTVLDLEPLVVEVADVVAFLFWDQRSGPPGYLEDPRWDPLERNWRPA